MSLQLVEYLPESLRLVGIKSEFDRSRGYPYSDIAMDIRSHAWANKLLGNDVRALTAELLFGRLAAVATQDIRVACTGMDVSISVDDQPIHSWCSFDVPKGSCLRIKPNGVGMFLYIGVEFGWNTQKSDRLIANGLGGNKSNLVCCPPRFWRRSNKLLALNFFVNPDFNASYRFEVEKFIFSTWLISESRSRMGVRLTALENCHSDSKLASLSFSIPVFPGDIQITPSGQPIVLQRGCQTIGGYQIMGTLDEKSLSLLSQASSGTKVCFHAITYEEWKENTEKFHNFFGI